MWAGCRGCRDVVRFTGVGLSLGAEVDLSEGAAWAAALPADATSEKRQEALALAVHAEVSSEYAAIAGCMGTGGDFAMDARCSRPWLA